MANTLATSPILYVLAYILTFLIIRIVNNFQFLLELLKTFFSSWSNISDALDFKSLKAWGTWQGKILLSLSASILASVFIGMLLSFWFRPALFINEFYFFYGWFFSVYALFTLLTYLSYKEVASIYWWSGWGLLTLFFSLMPLFFTTAQFNRILDLNQFPLLFTQVFFGILLGLIMSWQYEKIRDWHSLNKLEEYSEQGDDLLEKSLIEMANDPEIQRELKQIEQEFIITELDGLEFN